LLCPIRNRAMEKSHPSERCPDRARHENLPPVTTPTGSHSPETVMRDRYDLCGCEDSLQKWHLWKELAFATQLVAPPAIQVFRYRPAVALQFLYRFQG